MLWPQHASHAFKEGTQEHQKSIRVKHATKPVSPWPLEVCEGMCCLEELLVFEHL